MPSVLVSNNSELLRHLSSPPFRRLRLEVVVASCSEEISVLADRERPRLVLLDAELAGGSGYRLARELKSNRPDIQVVLVLGPTIRAAEMKQVVESGCDEALIAPISPDELYDAVALQLGLPKRATRRHELDLAVITDDGDRTIDGRVTNLSMDGARLVVPEALGEGTSLRLTITPDDVEGEAIVVQARIVWSHFREDYTVAGAQFAEMTPGLRAGLSRLTRWEILDEEECLRVVIKRNMTDATGFEDLAPALSGRVAFDLSQVAYINSLGARAWSDFLRELDSVEYEFHACSIPFVVQASVGSDMLGRGRIESFFAPYRCVGCDYQEERLLYTDAIVDTARETPTYACPNCERDLALDDRPERYLAFLGD